MNIYVGNLAWKTRGKELKELFENFGAVERAFIVREKKSRRSKGYGFVEMESEEAARAAIENLNETEFLGRVIVVNEAVLKEEEASANTPAGSEDENKEE